MAEETAFRAYTTQLIADMDSLMNATSTAEWVERFGPLKQRLRNWKAMYDALVVRDAAGNIIRRPTGETVDKAAELADKLTQALEKRMSFLDSAPAAGGSTRRRRRRRRSNK